MRRTSVISLVAVAALAASLFVAQDMLAQVKKGKSRLLLTKQLMKGLVSAQCGAVKKALDSSPADDKAWEEIGISAALLNEASYVLMDDGRCPDGKWAEAASKSLREGSAEVVAAAEKKDLEAAKKGFGTLTSACKNCHEAHKKKA